MQGRRNIAAPFQNKGETQKSFVVAPLKPDVADGFVNFRNFRFPPVENVSELKFNKVQQNPTKSVALNVKRAVISAIIVIFSSFFAYLCVFSFSIADRPPKATG